MNFRQYLLHLRQSLSGQRRAWRVWQACLGPWFLPRRPQRRHRPSSPLSLLELEARITPVVGLTPTQITTFYGINAIPNFGALLPGGGQPATGAGQTIAIVDAYNDPNIVSDLANFDLQANGLLPSGLPVSALPAPPNFNVFNQSGQNITSTSQGPGVSGANGVPALDPAGAGNPLGTWELEESLDVEWAHAIAPQASIDVVECNDSTDGNLTTGISTAAGLPGVSVVSMSVEGNDKGQLNAGTFVHSGVTFVGATGDFGAPSGYPAYFGNVLAVGGTSLNLTPTPPAPFETGWSGSGGGISTTEPRPAYQNQVQHSNNRTVPDVAFDGGTNVAIYDSYDTPATAANPTAPQTSVAGTSLSTPCWAGLIALANQGRAVYGAPPLNTANDEETMADLYTLPKTDFNDILSGSNDQVTGIAQLQGGNGYSPVPIQVQFSGSGGAVATAITSQGQITGFNITNAGNYPSAPTVTITGGGGTGVPVLTTTLNAQGGVAQINIPGPTGAIGSGYPSVDFLVNGVVSAGATGEPIINSSGQVTGVTLTTGKGGGGFITPPTVQFSGSTGTQATANAVLTGGFTAGAGYDEVTGLGTPIANKLIPDLVGAPTNLFGIGQPNPLAPETSDHGLALTAVNGQNFIAWRGNDNHDLNIMPLNPSGTGNEAGKLNLPNIQINSSPALATMPGLNNQFYVAWVGENDGNQLFVSHVTSNGGTLSVDQTALVPGATTGGSPALAAFNGHLYLAWTGQGNNLLNINEMAVNATTGLLDTDSGGNAEPFEPYTSPSGFTVNGSPALAASGGQFYVAFTGQANHNPLYDAIITDNGQINVSNPTELFQPNGQPETSTQSPALASFTEDINGQLVPGLVLAWIASDNGNHLQVMPLDSNGNPDEALHISSQDSANNGATFDPLNGGPALDNNNGNLEIAWTAPNSGLSTSAPLYDAPVGFDLNAVSETAALLVIGNPQAPGQLQAFNGATLVNSYNAGTFDQILLTEPAGSSSMTLDFSAGNFIPAGGLSFTGDGTDTLVLQGGSFTNEVITPTGPTSGTISLDGILISYTGVADIVDTVPVTHLTVDGTNSAGEQVHFSNDPNGTENGGIATAEINSPGGTFAKVDYGNKTNVLFEGGSGGDTYTLNSTTAAANLATLSLAGNSPGTDIFNVQATLPGILTTLDTSDGTSTVNVTPGSTDLAHLGGALTINGGARGSTALVVTDPNAAAGQSYTLTSTTLQAQGGTLITYNALQSLTLTGGPGADTYNLQGTAAGTATTVSSFADPLNTISNTFTVGSEAPAAGGTLGGVQGALTVLGGPKDTLTVDDTGDHLPQTGLLSGDLFPVSGNPTPTTLTGLGMGPAGITYGPRILNLLSFAQLNINLGSGGNTFTIQDTAFPTVTNLNTGSGNDSVLVQDTETAPNIDGGGGSDTVTLRGPVATHDPLTGPVTVADTGGMAAVVLDDSGDTTSQQFSLADNAVKVAGVPVVSFQASQVSSVTVLGGSGGNTFYDFYDTTAVPPTKLDGGAGMNEFFGPSADTTWAITGNGAGILNGSLTFASFQTIDSVSLNGTLDLSALTTPQTWNLTGNGGGSVAGISFFDMNHLIGSSAGNDFIFNSGGQFDSIDGNGGANTFDCSADSIATITVTTLAADGSASGTASFLRTGFSEIDEFIGGSGTFILTGPANPTWNITRPDAGTLDGTVSFSAFAVEPLAPTSISLTSDSSSGATYGQTVTLTATVSSLAGDGVPSGNVQFVVDGNATTVPFTSGTATLPLSGLPAGTDSITASYGSSPTDLANLPLFADSTTASPLVQAVAPAPLTITADNQSMVAGAPLPTLTASYSGFVNGDTPASLTTPPTLTTPATSASGAGSYAVTPAGAVDPNYAITYVPGTLTITSSSGSSSGTSGSGSGSTSASGSGSSSASGSTSASGSGSGSTSASGSGSSSTSGSGSSSTSGSTSTSNSGSGSTSASGSGSTSASGNSSLSGSSSSSTSTSGSNSSSTSTSSSGSGSSSSPGSTSPGTSGSGSTSASGSNSISTSRSGSTGTSGSSSLSTAGSGSSSGSTSASGSGSSSQSHSTSQSTSTGSPSSQSPGITVTPQLKAHGGTVSFKSHAIVLSDHNSHALLKVQLRATRGQLRLHATGIKVTVNNSRALSLTGTAAAIDRALLGLSLILGPGHSAAAVSVTVSDGLHSSQATIKIVA